MGELGRIVIPNVIRDELALVPGTELEIWLENGIICIKRCEPACRICGLIRPLNERKVCKDCVQGMKENTEYD